MHARTVRHIVPRRTVTLLVACLGALPACTAISGVGELRFDGAGASGGSGGSGGLPR
ncbi:hypothetical protein [Sorangium sp. So ce1335]|uniref:hypothetical protein n=1 Tax=Sorangium sp. So ce1335 TaxID=3133335 RepID=UPI003F5D6D6C